MRIPNAFSQWKCYASVRDKCKFFSPRIKIELEIYSYINKLFNGNNGVRQITIGTERNDANSSDANFG